MDELRDRYTSPHGQWISSMVQRLQEKATPPEQVDEIISSVQEACERSSKNPQELFGDPRTYADRVGSLHHQVTTGLYDDPRFGFRNPSYPMIFLLFATIMSTTGAAFAAGSILGDGSDVTVTWGAVVGPSLTLLFLLSLTRLSIEQATKHFLSLVLMGIVIVCGLLIVTIFITQPLLSIPAIPLAVVTALVNIAATVGIVATARRATREDKGWGETLLSYSVLPPALLLLIWFLAWIDPA